MPRLPPCLTGCLSAGLLNVLGPIFLLLVVMFSNSSTPPAALHMSRSYPVQMYTDWNSVPFYVKNRSGFLKEYPNHSIRRQKFEHMVQCLLSHAWMCCEQEAAFPVLRVMQWYWYSDSCDQSA